MPDTKTEDKSEPTGTAIAEGKTATGVIVTVKDASPPLTPEEQKAAEEHNKLASAQTERDRLELSSGDRGRDKTEFIPRGEGFPAVETPSGNSGVTYPKDDGQLKAAEAEAKKHDLKGVDLETGPGPGDPSTYDN